MRQAIAMCQCQTSKLSLIANFGCQPSDVDFHNKRCQPLFGGRGRQLLTSTLWAASLPCSGPCKEKRRMNRTTKQLSCVVEFTSHIVLIVWRGLSLVLIEQSGWVHLLHQYGEALSPIILIVWERFVSCIDWVAKSSKSLSSSLSCSRDMSPTLTEQWGWVYLPHHLNHVVEICLLH